MKSDQLIECNKANFFFKNHLRYKQVVCSLVLIYLTITLNFAYTKNKVYKYLD